MNKSAVTHIDTAAGQHVEAMLARADGKQGPYLWWHGWAIREAFVAGAKWEAQREQSALQAIADAEPTTIIYEANYTYEAPCDRCKDLIAMARVGLEGSE